MLLHILYWVRNISEDELGWRKNVLHLLMW